MLVSNDTSIYAGETEITKVYNGTNVVYEKQTTPYTVLNYIEGTGTQYINTGYICTDSTKTELELSNVTGNDRPVISGSTDWNSGRYIMTTQDGRFIFWYAGKHEFGPATTTGTTNISDKHKISVYRDVIIYDDVYQYTDATNRNIMNRTNVYIFATPGNQRSPNMYRLYYLKMWNSDVLVRDFIPVLDENNVPCLYDKVTETYFYNQGTGTFSYG